MGLLRLFTTLLISHCFLVLEPCLCPCTDEDYNTIVETPAIERTSAELRVGIEETLPYILLAIANRENR